MIRTRLGLLAAGFCVLQTGALGARAETSGSPFLAISLDQALARAAKEKRIVFIDFYTTWCGPCKLLDNTTWKDEKVIALLNQKTLALKIDAEKETALSKKYGINAYPTLLLLKPDGSILDRMVGYQTPEQFATSLQSALEGKDSLARARETAAYAKKDDLKSQIDARYKLARALAEQNKDEEALKEFLWLYDDGMKQVVEFTGVRVAFLLSDLARLGARYPPAMEALRQRRDEAKKSFLAAPEAANSSTDLPYLNRCLSEDGATLELFDQLPKGSPGRKTLSQFILRELVTRQRYAEAVEIRPLKTFLKADSHWESRIKDPKSGSVFRSLYIKNCVQEIEALAGAGSLEDAAVLIKKALSLDATQETSDLVKAHLKRAGHPELLK